MTCRKKSKSAAPPQIISEQTTDGRRQTTGIGEQLSVNRDKCADESAIIAELKQELRIKEEYLQSTNEELRNSQAEMEAARERYFDLYDLAPVGYCTISEKGLIAEANLTASNLLGVSRNTLSGRLFSSFILKEDQSLYYQHRRKLIQAGEPQGCELRLIKQDGVLFWAHLTASAAQKTEDGAPLFRVVLSDITGRKLAEEALQRKEHDLSESQRIAHVGSWRLDLKTNQVVWTEELYHMYGFDPSLPPPPYTEHMKLFTPESWKRLSTAIARTKDTGISYTLELETVRKDGSKGWMWVLGEADVDSAGKKVGLWGAAQDITERKREQESLRESELKFRTLVEVSSSGIWSTDAAGLNTYVSPRWSEITGMSEADATGRGWASGLHPDDRIPVRTGWEEAANVAQPYVSEFRFVRPDGRLVWVLCQASPLMVGGEITEWIGTITDITARKNAEENLRESEARFRSLFENHAAVKLIINLATGAIIDVNPAAANYYGWSRETMRQMRIQDINTLSPQEVEREMQVAAEEHRNYFEFRHRRADGSIRDVAVFSSNVATPGNAAILYSVVNDITESKQSESLLAFLARSCANPASGDFFRMLARYISETLDMGFVCIDRLDGDNLTAHTEAVYSNGRFEDNVSYALKDTPCGEVVGKQVCCFPASIKTLFPNDAVLQQMAAESYIGITLWSHDGRPIGLIAVIGARPLTRRSQAESILRLVGVRAAAELERKLAEERLLHAYRQMESIIEATRVGTWEWNIQTGATIFNEEWARIIGYTLNELEPVSIKTWETFTHPDDLKKSDELLKRHFAGELQYYDCDCRIRHKNGQWIWINDRGRVITRTADGKPLMMLGIHTDITERKQNEVKRENLQLQLAQSQKMESVGQLAGGISHDFNNLLSIINGYAKMLHDDEMLKESQRLKLEEIMRAGELATSLTRQLLMFTRRQPMESQVIDLNDTVSVMSKMLRRLIPENIKMEISAQPELWHIKVDPGQIEQMIMNLTVNARDAMPDGGKLTVKTENVVIEGIYNHVHPSDIELGHYVVLSISDTGCGMDENVKQHMFEPFFTTKEKGNGTGLGLAIVYSVVKQTNAFIDVQSELGKGTGFRIYFPRISHECSAAETASKSMGVSGGSETILLAEDQNNLRELIREFLQSIGYCVLSSANAEEALEHAKNHNGPIHLLLTDIVLPEISGFELAKMIRKSLPDIKMLFMSGHIKSSETHGMISMKDNFIQKPISIYALASKLRELLKQTETKDGK